MMLQFGVTMDELFVRYLLKATVALEVHRAIGTEYQTLAVANVFFRMLIATSFHSVQIGSL